MPYLSQHSAYSPAIHDALVPAAVLPLMHVIEVDHRKSLSELLLPRIILSRFMEECMGGAGSAAASSGPPAAAGFVLYPDFVDEPPWRCYPLYHVYIGHDAIEATAHSLRFLQGAERLRAHFANSSYGWAVRHCNGSSKPVSDDAVAFCAKYGVTFNAGLVNAVAVDDQRGTITLCVNDACHRQVVEERVRGLTVIEREGQRALIAPTKKLSVTGLEALSRALQFGVSRAGVAALSADGVDAANISATKVLASQLLG